MAPFLGGAPDLVAGGPADFLLVRADAPELNPGHQLANLVYAASGSVVDATVVAGTVLIRGGVVPDAADVVAHARERASASRGAVSQAQVTLRIVSPTRTCPASTTFVFAPRSRSARPSAELTNRSAARPNRSLNFRHPVCGGAVISITALPTVSRVPAGTFASLRSKSTYS